MTEQDASVEMEALLTLKGSPARKGVPLTFDISKAHAVEALCRVITKLRASEKSLTNEILACQASDKALADFRKGVSAIADSALAFYERAGEGGCLTAQCLKTLIIPAPDPLVEMIESLRSEPFHRDAPSQAKQFRDAAERLGYTIKLERIDQ